MRVAVVAESNSDINERSVDGVVRRLAGNAGNLAFQQVLFALVYDTVSTVSWDDPPREVEREHDVLIIPEASVLIESKDFGWKADFVEAVDLPMLAVGVGRQAELGTERIAMPAGTQRYMQALVKRSRTIGVRGERTAEELGRIGIHNTEVLGCPSLFWSPDAPDGVLPDRLRMVASPGPDRRTLRAVHRTMARWVVQTGGYAVAQSGRLLRTVLEGGTSAPLVGRSWRSRPGRVVPVRAFVDVPAWIDFLRSFDVSVGARIHGALLAVAAGVPAVCVIHDDRTRELAATSAIPTSTPDAVQRVPTLQAYLERVEFDWPAHSRRKRALAGRFISVLEDYGLTPSAHLHGIARPDLGTTDAAT